MRVPSSRVQLRELLGQDPEAFVRQSLLDELAVLHVMTDQELLGENPESLHEFRVAVRTLRTRLKFYEPFFKNRSKINKWLKELKWLDSRIQPLRELEVQIALFEELTQDTLQLFVSKPAKHQELKKRLNALKTELSKPMFETRQKMQFALLSERKHRLLTDIKTGLLLSQIKPKKILLLEDVLLKELAKRVDQLQKVTEKPNFAKLSFKKLHGVRLNFKRARYLAEAIGLASKSFADSQTLLGDINDLENLDVWVRSRMATLGRKRKLMGAFIAEIDSRLTEKRSSLSSQA
ncbi:MAG: hypothetical protein RLZ28_483 [Actinomycetota bacterium]